MTIICRILAFYPGYRFLIDPYKCVITTKKLAVGKPEGKKQLRRPRRR
jgi:hypothetical protein